MNALQIFEHPKFGKIRTIVEDGKTLFCGKDAAEALKYNEPHKAIARHCKGGTKRPVPTKGGMQELVFISEGDLCRLAAKSEMPGADAFERWIFDEVIPSILRTGTYTVPSQQTAPRISLPEGVSLNGLARLLSITRRIMMDMGNTPAEIGLVAKSLYERMRRAAEPGIFQTAPRPDQLLGLASARRLKEIPCKCYQHLQGQAKQTIKSLASIVYYSAGRKSRRKTNENRIDL